MALFPDDLMKTYQRQRTNAALGAFAQGLLQSGARGGGLLAGLGQGAAGASQAMASGGLGDLVKLQYLSQAQEADRERKAQGAALSEVTGGYDPQSGITWNSGRPQNAGLLGNLTPQQRGLLPNLPEPMRRSVVMNQAFPDPGEGFTLNPGDVRFGPDGRPIAAAPPKPPENSATYRDWQAERRNGYKGSFLDYQKEIKAAGASNITVGGGKYGTIPPGMELQETPDGARLVPIPGGPVEAERTIKEGKEEASRRLAATSAKNVLDTIDRLETMVSGESFLAPVTGFSGDLLSRIGGTPANDARNLVETIKANVQFDKLQALRDASPTGGAVGQLSDPEREAMGKTIQALEQSQTQEQFLTNLEAVKVQFADTVHGYSKMSEQQLESVDPSGLDNAQLKAYIRAIEVLEATSGKSPGS